MKLKTTFFKTAFMAVFVCGSVSAQDINSPLAHYYFEGNTTNSGTLGTSADLQVLSGTSTYKASTVEAGMSGNQVLDCSSVGNAFTTGTDGWQGITGNNARTIAGWIYIPEAQWNRTSTIVSMGTVGDGARFTFKYYSYHGPRVEVEHSNSVHTGTGLWGGTNPANGSINSDEWTFVAVTMPTGGLLEDVVFYVNDNKFTNEPGTHVHEINTAPGPVLVGSQPTSSGEVWGVFGGLIDGLRIYDFQASDAQIAEIKNLTTLSTKNQAFTANELSIYPNAVTDYLNIESTVANKFDVLVFDMLGKVVTRTSVANKLDMSSLATGLYIVKIRSGNKISSFKVAKK
ncbi:MAG: T9SS type A sorting domain-containing protein [Flavobacteriaceae bacterium]